MKRDAQKTEGGGGGGMGQIALERHPFLSTGYRGSLGDKVGD